MILYDFFCNDCNKKFEVVKVNMLVDFEKENPCEHCGSLNTRRVWSYQNYSMCEGMAGNSANGYQTSVVYHPSPLGRFKGKKIKV